MARGNGNGNGRGRATAQGATLSREERLARVQDAQEGLGKAKTASEAMDVWAEHYLTLGHRVLGRLLLGQSVEQAMRTRKGGGNGSEAAS